MSSCSLLLLLKLHSVWTSSNTAYMSETRNLGTLIERWWRSRGRCLIKINVRRSKFIGVKQPELKYCDIFMAGKNVEYDFVNSLIASVALCIKLWDGRACSKEVTLFKEGGILAEFDLSVYWSLSLIDHCPLLVAYKREMMGEKRRVGCFFSWFSPQFEMLWNVRRPC